MLDRGARMLDVLEGDLELGAMAGGDAAVLGASVGQDARGDAWCGPCSRWPGVVCGLGGPCVVCVLGGPVLLSVAPVAAQRGTICSPFTGARSVVLVPLCGVAFSVKPVPWTVKMT